MLTIDEVRLEKTFGSLKPLASYSDHTAIGKRVALYQYRSIFAQALVQFQVIRHIAEFFLDLTDRLKIGGSIQGITPP